MQKLLIAKYLVKFSAIEAGKKPCNLKGPLAFASLFNFAFQERTAFTCDVPAVLKTDTCDRTPEELISGRQLSLLWFVREFFDQISKCF